MLVTLASIVLATSPIGGADPQRHAITTCLQSERFALNVDGVLTARQQLSDVDWRTACRQARDANDRHRSVVRVLLATGTSPVGGYVSTTRLLAQAAAAPDPTVADLFRRSAREQAARESLSRLARETYARGLSPLALRLLDGLVSAEAVQADLDNRTWLAAVVTRRGWFRISRDGDAADAAAWLMVQHADADRDFQRRAIGWLEPLVAAGETSPVRFAYLYDRWAAGAGQPQRFGLQGSCGEPGRWEPLPIEDADNIDIRRRAAGLDSTQVEWNASQSARCK